MSALGVMNNMPKRGLSLFVFIAGDSHLSVNNIHLCYFSPTGTTRLVLESIAGSMKSEETRLHVHDWLSPESRTSILECSPDDLVLVGMPVYYGRIPSLFHAGLPLRGNGALFVPVVVYGNRHYDDALLELKNLGEAAGCTCLGAGAFIARHSLNPHMGEGRPDAEDHAMMHDFGKQIAERAARHAVPGSVSVPGKMPYVPYGKTPFTPVLLDHDACIACGTCVSACPVRLIDPETFEPAKPEQCLFCYGCVRNCPVQVRGPVPAVAEVFDNSMNQLAARCTERRVPETFF